MMHLMLFFICTGFLFFSMWDYLVLSKQIILYGSLQIYFQHLLLLKQNERDLYLLCFSCWSVFMGISSWHQKTVSQSVAVFIVILTARVLGWRFLVVPLWRVQYFTALWPGCSSTQQRRADPPGRHPQEKLLRFRLREVL